MAKQKNKDEKEKPEKKKEHSRKYLTIWKMKL